jgi:Retrotransposon gag protein
VTRYESVTKSKLSDEQAVDLVADSLTDKARAWWNNIVDSNELQADDFPGYAVQKKPADLNEMLNAVLKEFSELNSNENRRDRYEALVQGSGSIQDYQAAVRDALMFLFPKPSEYEILRKFKAGLNIDVLCEMDKHYSNITSFLDYVKKADDIDRGLQLEKETRRRRNQTVNPSPPNPSRFIRRNRTNQDSSSSSNSTTKPARVYTIDTLKPSKKRDPEN